MASKGARVHIYGDWDGSGVKKAQQDIGAFEKQATGFSGAFSKSMVGVGAALGGAFAIGSIATATLDFLKDAAGAAIEDEKSVVSLSKAMDNLGLSAQTSGMEQFARDTMLATGTADDLIRNGLQKLVTATGDAEEAQRLLSLSMDVSAATGKDLAGVTQAMAKASLGNVGALTRLGVPLDANIVKSKDFGAAVDVLTTKFGGQAAAAADTYGGQLKRTESAADEAKETIGYALLDAVDNASKAFGGSGGMVDAITGAGESLADFVAGLGQATTTLAGFLASANDLRIGTDEVGVSFGDIAKNAAEALPFIGVQIKAYQAISDSGHEYRATQEQINASIDASESLYAGYIATLDSTASKTRKAAMDSEDLAAQLDEVKDSFLSLNAALNASQSMDDFRKSLYDLDDTLKKNVRTFKGMGDAAKENRDTLRGAFSDAAAIAQKWAEDNGKSAEQAQAYYDRLGSKIVGQFVKDGFKKSDVMAFLGSEGVWTGPAADRMKAIGRKGSLAAYAAGQDMGRDLGLGTIAGLAAQSAGVQAAGIRLIAQAEAAARDAAESNSPSKLFARVGHDLTAGLVQGIREGGDDVRVNLQETYKEWFTSTRGTLKDGLDAAKAEFRDFSASVSSAIMGGIDFGAAAPQFDEAGNRVGSSFIESLQAQATKAQDFAKKVKELVTLGLSQASLQQVLAAGVTAGTAIANELITGGATTITQTNELVATTQAAADKVGLIAATNFYGAGVASAQATYDGFKANFGAGGPARQAMMGVMDSLANSMRRETTITVTTVNRLVNEVVSGKRAAGGPVAAGKAYLVGEKGPELFIPNSESGNIIPNSDLPTAGGSYGSSGSSGGGNSYSITVQAGVGDPRQIGQQVVEYIRRFESANGAVFAAA